MPTVEGALVEATRVEAPGIDLPERAIAEFCERWKVTSLSLFGSVLRDEFGPDGTVMTSWAASGIARWTWSAGARQGTDTGQGKRLD